jgi:cellulose synthase/poly-beta-1,6-N-acetylglucosamine synthase-like glycosyltransferase
MIISIIVPTKNEEKNIQRVLDTLIVQEKPIEIIVVDAGSTDSTQRIVKKYMEKYDSIKLYIKKGRRGESMNYAIKKANGDAVAFIGADDRAHKNWLKYLRKALEEGHNIVVGKCLMKGKKEFAELDRVELYHKGFDISYPGTNTAYKKDVLNKIGGFDADFITAEDIDLNYRAVDAGYKIHYTDKAIVYRCARDTLLGFLKQAFWNGYGRKQLTLKHGRLWDKYSPKKMFKTQVTFWGLIRLGTALLGYLACKIREEKYG